MSLLSSLRFVGCQRCLGHGHFEIPGSATTSFEVYSQIDAYYFIQWLWGSGLIRSPMMVDRLTQQVQASGLPYEVPEDVALCIQMSLSVQLGLMGYARDPEQGINFDDIRDAVHQHYLVSPNWPHLRLQ